MLSSTKKKSIFISVCLPTYGREQVLCNTINDLIDQDYDNFEILVADQTEQHNESTLLFLKSVENQIRYYKLPNPSLTQARNFCIKNALGEILIFIDDDVMLGKNFVFNHAKNFSDNSIYAVGGPVFEDDRRDVPNLTANPLTIMGRPVLNRSSKIRGEINSWCGGNISFRKKVFTIIGPFDDKLPKPWWREDSCVFFRMKRKKLKIIYDPDAGLKHLRAIEGGCQNDRAHDNNPSLNIDVFSSETIFHLKFYSKFSLPLTLIFQFFWLVLKFNWKNPYNLVRSTIIMIKGFFEGYSYFMNNYQIQNS